MENADNLMVFISTNSNTKDIELARCLNEKLKEKNITTHFYEESFSGSIPKEIERAILDSTIFVPIFSPEYLNSKYCTLELEAWISKQADYHKNNQLTYSQQSPFFIIPIKWQECNIPYTFRSDQSISATTCEEVFEKLMAQIQKERPSQPKEPCPPTIEPCPPTINIYNYYRPEQDEQQGSPYILRSLEPEDAEVFNKRKIFLDIREEIVKKIDSKECNFITLKGESGGGKSSLILAGVIPQLAKQNNCNWQFVYIQLNENPFNDLAKGLVAIKNDIRGNKYDRRNEDEINKLTKQLKEEGVEYIEGIFSEILKTKDTTSRILLFVDQLESLYSKCEADIRSSFLEKLTSFSELKASNQIVLLATLDPAGIATEGEKDEIDPDYQNFIDKSVTDLSSLTDLQLIALIQNPAKQKEVEIADDLVKQIIEDLGANKNDLFLLGAILDNLWETIIAKDIKKVTTEHYQHSSVKAASKALDRFANKFFEKLDKKSEKELAKGLFLSMIYRVDDNNKITTQSKIIESDDYDEVINKLSRTIKRTNIGGEGKKRKLKIEFAHKKIAENWGLLKKWSAPNKGNFEKARDLENYSKQWKDGYDYKIWWPIIIDWSYLITGKHLRDKKEFYDEHKVLLNDEKSVESFLKRSRFVFRFFVFLIAVSSILGSLAAKHFVDVISESEAIKKEEEREKRDEILSRMSFGEKILTTHSNFDKSEGVNKYKEGAESYNQAYAFFEGAHKSDRSDPETLIYLNNARVSEWEKEYQRSAYSFAASVPAGANRQVAFEMLRGIAWVQHELNQNCLSKKEKKLMSVCTDGIDGKPLKIMIINDDNNIDVATKIAEELVKDDRIMAVVGHNASEVSTAAAEVYQKQGLVMVTPTSFALRFDELDVRYPSRKEKNYIFAVPYSYELLMEKIIPVMKKQSAPKKPVVLICFDQKSFDQKMFAQSLKDSGIETFGAYDKEKGQDLNRERAKDFLCDFSKPDIELSGKLKELFEENLVNTIFLASHVNKIGDSVLALRKIKDSLKGNNPSVDKKKIYFFGSSTLYTSTTLELGEEFEDELVLAVAWFPPNSQNEVISCTGSENLNSEERGPITAENFYHEARKFWCDSHGRGITWRTAMAYDSTKILIEGLKRATDKDSRASLQSIIAGPNFQLDGVTGKIKFYSDCQNNGDNSSDSDNTRVFSKCALGKRMKIEKDPITLVKIRGGPVPEGYKFYGFEKLD